MGSAPTVVDKSGGVYREEPCYPEVAQVQSSYWKGHVPDMDRTVWESRGVVRRDPGKELPRTRPREQETPSSTVSVSTPESGTIFRAAVRW